MLRETESVWDFPRPPRVENTQDRIIVKHGDIILIDTADCVRVLETSHPPTYYLQIRDFLPNSLIPVAGNSMCEFKGLANYFDVKLGNVKFERSAWGYKTPNRGFELLAGRVAIYPGNFDFCSVNGEKVIAQEGDFYGGWINSWITGPFKGGPQTMGW